MADLSRVPEPDISSSRDAAGSKLYHCGPLRYTTRGLVILFAWLLWGDFCFQLMETVAPSILPLKLKALGVSNITMSVILTVLPSIMNLTICPWVSSASDRYRSKWGRRIPFILWTMPFLTLCLILLGWSDAIAPKLQHLIPRLANLPTSTIIVCLIGVFSTAFAFFNMFVGSVFWYLFNDVVPPQFLGRFMGLFRIVSAGVTASYNWFLFEHGVPHMRSILTIAALIYLVGFGLMCLRVKEGEYPPPPPDDTSLGTIPAIRTFLKQSFSAKFYWLFYLMQACTAQTSTLTSVAAGFFVFFYQDMGLTLKQVGMLTSLNLIAGLAATWTTAVFVDRWHPLRVRMYVAIFAAVTGFGGWIWLCMTLPGNVFFWVSLGGILVARFSVTLSEAAEIPLFMRLMPKSIYGQFSSANAIVRTIVNILAGLALGMGLDALRRYYGGDFAYRWLFIWPWIFGIGSAVFVCMGYREWLRLGGDDNYRPPTPWTPEGFEEVTDKVQTAPARPGIVMASLWLGVIAMIVNIVLVLVFMYFMHHYALSKSLHWYAWIFLPIKLSLMALACWQLIAVRRDITAQQRGEATRYGVPHHGVLMVNAIQGLIYFPVFWYQTIEMIHLNLDHELILFGVANLLTTAGTILGVHIVRWIERTVATPMEATERLASASTVQVG